MMAVKWQDKKKLVTILTMMHNNNGTVGKTSMKTGNLLRNQSLSLTITKVWGMAVVVVVVVVVVDRMDEQLASYPLMSHYLKGYNNRFFDMMLFNAYIMYKKIILQTMKFNQSKLIFMFC
jgi:hypothetical protein